MLTLRISESRLALVISIAALAATLWQGYESKKANDLNQEALTVEVQPSDIPSKRIEKVVCIDGNVAAIYMYWRVNIFNSSSLPVTIKDIFSMSSSPAGTVSGINSIGKDGPVNRQFPSVVESKNFKTFLLSVPTLTSEPFKSWFRSHGGCDGKLDWVKSTDRGGFSETGWPTARAVNAYFNVATGSGNNFNVISNWP
ncbi:hypothetical protein [Pseudogulbenkiania subflava]|uniref:Uncharacterized protein n=1 Tax=Pseudogulbenkiania subflava DSM 22618 TaxID=1123014 RepID=A0A1Y6BWM2_9NEIS|nr:hypothetical protein [Pseudogulbenkiania subflava]SMF22064.1 hypothetical protein SAMN02745746_01945 [Pseudogulbenkiania subflava DSM 22618]